MGFSEVMKALSDPTRREILNMLKSGAMAATDIADRFDMSGAAVSKHLAVLREAELVRTRREGKYIYYELTASVLEEVMLWIQNLREESKRKKHINGRWRWYCWDLWWQAFS